MHTRKFARRVPSLHSQRLNRIKIIMVNESLLLLSALSHDSFNSSLAGSDCRRICNVTGAFGGPGALTWSAYYALSVCL